MFIASRYQGRKVAIVAEDTPFGATVSASLLASLQSAGFQSVREHKYARGAIGERAFPDAVRDRPDVIFIAGWRPDILQTLESLGGQTSGPTIVATSTALPVDEALARRVSERAFIVAKPPHAQIAAQGAPLNEVGAYTFAAVQVAALAFQKAGGEMARPLPTCCGSPTIRGGRSWEISHSIAEGMPPVPTTA